MARRRPVPNTNHAERRWSLRDRVRAMKLVGYSNDQIAEFYGISKNSVLSLLKKD